MSLQTRKPKNINIVKFQVQCQCSNVIKWMDQDHIDHILYFLKAPDWFNWIEVKQIMDFDSDLVENSVNFCEFFCFKILTFMQQC